jgi:hypothetical protein
MQANISIITPVWQRHTSLNAGSKSSRRTHSHRRNTRKVWTAPLSLATTNGIQAYRFIVFNKEDNKSIDAKVFSFPPATEMFHFAGSSSHILCIQIWIFRLQRKGFPHSDIPGSKVACHLTEAFRRLRRPSSSFDV